MAERHTRVRASQIASIRPSDITESATNSPTDGQIPAKATGEDKWVWVDNAGAFNLKIQKDDTQIAQNVNIINFEGRVKVIDEGSNKVTIKVKRRGKIVI